MEKNHIFDGAEFGDRYRTKDGRLAIFVYDHRSGYLMFAVEGTVNIQLYNADGTFHNWDSGPESGWTIASKDGPGQTASVSYWFKRLRLKMKSAVWRWIINSKLMN